ncbi:hypothetical protein D3C72_2457160 [compost metagenome]
MGIFLMDNGFKNSCTLFSGISRFPFGLASPVPILETVLFIDSAKLMGNPVSLVTDCASSLVHL